MLLGVGVDVALLVGTRVVLVFVDLLAGLVVAAKNRRVGVADREDATGGVGPAPWGLCRFTVGGFVVVVFVVALLRALVVVAVLIIALLGALVVVAVFVVALLRALLLVGFSVTLLRALVLLLPLASLLRALVLLLTLLLLPFFLLVFRVLGQEGGNKLNAALRGEIS